MTTHNVGRAVLSGTDNLHLDNFIGQLEPDDQLWFVMKEADKQGLSPVEAAWAF